MFTGLIEESGIIQATRPTATGRDLTIRVPASASVPASLRDANVGDSIAVNGICLTVTALHGDSFVCHAGAETLARSTAGDWQPGSRVNLEQALQVGDRLGGHFVQGHVDCVGACVGRRPVGETIEFSFELPEAQTVYLAEKGSIAVDGISLTIATLNRNRFTVAIIPHTLAQTTLDNMQPGTRVNIEVDILAKYVRRSLGLEQQGISEDFLREHGFG
jgi:riboflavin synthase